MLNRLKRFFIIVWERKKPTTYSTLGFSGFFNLIEKDDVYDQPSEDSTQEIRPTTGWESLRKMFSYDQYGMPTPQSTFIYETMGCSFLMGFTYGGMKTSRAAFHKFVGENKLSSFANHYIAKRRLTDKMLAAWLTGGFKYGFKLSIFSTLLFTIILSLSTYRGKMRVSDFVIGGVTAGGIYKLKEGPKPMVAGGVAGGILGVISGIIIITLFKLTGLEIQDIHEFDSKRLQDYEKHQKERVEKAREKKLERELKYKREITDDTSTG